MWRRMQVPLVVMLALLTLVIFSACSINRAGTIPRGTPDKGNGTPAVIMTPTPDLSHVQQAPQDAKGANYAFVRKNQLWLTLKGAASTQITQFDYKGEPNIFWQQPLWGQGDRFLAFIINAQPAGVGGGGCGSPDNTASGAAYIVDTQTKQLITFAPKSGGKSVAATIQPEVGQWRQLFWEDATHLLAWYNGDTGKTSGATGLYRYSIESKSLKQVLPLSTLTGNIPGGGSGEKAPLLLSLRYSSGQLFYQIVVHPFEQQSELVIYRHSVLHPEEPSSKAFSQGQEAWCGTQQSGAYTQPGWDISPDGEQLVTQLIVSGALGQGVSTVQAVDVKQGSKTDLFTTLEPELLSQDLALTWGPDNQTVVAAEYHPVLQRGPYSASLANPAETKRYAPNLAGKIAWRGDSSAFALQRSILAGESGEPAVYLFLTGDSQGRVLLADAQEFSWG